MGPKYRLHYLGLPSRGEFIRLIFHHAKVEFTEKNYSFDDLPSVKANHDMFPLGQLPTLEIEGKRRIFQSHAIVRYLANEFNLYGKTNEERAIVDQILDTLKELEQKMWASLFFGGDQTAEKQKEAFGELFPRAFGYVESVLKENNVTNFLFGKKISVADIHIAVTIETIYLPHNKNYRNVLDDFPLTKALNERVRNSPNIKKYLESRGEPKYPFPVQD